MKHRVSILGINVAATTYVNVIRHVSSWVRAGKKTYICVAAVHLIMECQHNPALLAGVNRAGLVVPDGMPLVWMLRHAGLKTGRVYGPLLMDKLCAEAQRRGWSIFLLGGGKGQSVLLSNALHQKCPRLRIVGALDTPGKILSITHNNHAVQTINRSGATIVFVGIGCPNQELWMIENRKKLTAPVLIGVGAAFNFLTGVEKQAPACVQNAGLEWLYRLSQNPHSLLYRYTALNFLFVAKIFGALATAFAQKIIHKETR